MSRISMAGGCTALCAVFLMASAAHALSPADKCESSEQKISGKYSFCRLKADSKAVKSGGSPDFSKCDSTFSTKFGDANTQGMGQCPSSATQAEIQTFITQCTDDVAAALGGAPLPVCQPPPLKTGQTTAYGTGTDGDLQKGASQLFTDNGDGTITDNTTGLMWEKKDRSGGIHDWSKTYNWCVDVSQALGHCDNGTFDMDGTIVTVFLPALNGGSGFAGHTDWRIPNINELESIRNLENGNPATSSAFNTGCVASCTVTMCSCTQSFYYWSSTTDQTAPYAAWAVHFYAGGLLAPDKGIDMYYARAVRNAP
jgi:hypothetical protein